jgi:hypothetical protein
MANRVLRYDPNGQGGPRSESPAPLASESPSSQAGDPEILFSSLGQAIQIVLSLIEQVQAAEEHSPLLESLDSWADRDYFYIEADLPAPARRARVDINYTRGHVLIRSSRATAESDRKP